MKLIHLFTFIICFPLFIKAQQRDFKVVYTSDIDHFWQAYDSVASAVQKQAVKTIIELDYTNNQQIIAFLNQSGYYTEPINL